MKRDVIKREAIINKVISRIPIFLFLAIVASSFLVIYVFPPEEQICNNNSDVIFYIANEIIQFVYAGFMLTYELSKKDTELEFCWYNKIAIRGLLLLPIINLVATFTPMDVTFYNSLITQFIVAFFALLAAVLLIRRR